MDNSPHQLTRVRVLSSPGAPKTDHGLVRVVVLNSPDDPKPDRRFIGVVTESGSKPISRHMTAADVPRANKIGLAARMIAGGFGDAAAARNHFGLSEAETTAAMEQAKTHIPKPARGKSASRGS